ncbi:MAG: hypothetical protein JXM73_03410 [Anaerolineae bacterium]|nr:hypothetical protein [Anaerolineae bacterium]
MKSKYLLLAKALISIVIAFFMLFFARTFLNWFLKTGIPDAATLDQIGGLAGITGFSGLGNLIKLGFGYFGAMLVGVAIICFFASSATASALRKNVMISLAIADTIGFVLALIAQFSGKFNGLGWILVAIWFLLALFLAYFAFLKPED